MPKNWSNGEKMIIQKVKSSEFIWKFSGLTYRWGVKATRGKYMSFSDYMKNSKSKMSQLRLNFEGMEVLEFGCGLGGNLLSISEEIKFGVGLDVNSLYIRQANKFRKKLGHANLNFVVYDGRSIPALQLFDIIFSLNVFERISRNAIVSYLRQLKNLSKSECHMCLFFLGENAKGTGFTDRLGENAYTFWNVDQINDMLSKLDFREWQYELQAIPIMPGEPYKNAYLLTLKRGKST